MSNSERQNAIMEILNKEKFANESEVQTKYYVEEVKYEKEH